MQGLPADGPALGYNKEQTIFSSGTKLAGELGLVTLDDDDEWKKYPGMGEQYQKLTGDENCYAVAISKEHELCASYPDFKSLIQKVMHGKNTQSAAISSP